MSFTLGELARRLDGRVVGDVERELTDVAPLESAEPVHLSYLESHKQLSKLKRSCAGAVLIRPELAESLPPLPQTPPLTWILVREPQAAFIEAMLLFRPEPARSEIGVSGRAFVSSTASLGADCNIFPNAQIGENVTLGVRCEVGPGAIIGDGCVLGDDCVIHANCVLYPGVQLRNRIIVHANAVIGSDGFGYRFIDGALVKIPHTGTVLIEDDVEIGACATIDRAMIGATVIGQGTKLDNQVQIAHNCRIGRHNGFASQVGLAGSVTTGDYVQCGGQVGIPDHIVIGSGVRFGGKAGILADVLEPGVYLGIPAVPKKEAAMNHLNIRRLGEMRQQIKQLTAQVAALQCQLADREDPPEFRFVA